MTPGTRLVQEVVKAHLYKTTKDGPIFDQGIVDDLGQQIDAAIATAREEKDKAWLEEIASHGGWASDEEFARRDAERAAGEKALAEREAQIAALHGQLRVGVAFVKNGAPNEHFMEWARNADRICAAIGDAARAFVERMQAKERERCAQEAVIVAQQRGDEGWVERVRVARTIEQRIRALGEK